MSPSVPPLPGSQGTPGRPGSSNRPRAPKGTSVGGPRRAVAISYDPAQRDVPVVTAVGEGLVADEIIRRAREAGVTVTEDPALATVLSQIDVGTMIPEELYTVVAEVLAYVYRLEERIGRRR